MLCYLKFCDRSCQPNQYSRFQQNDYRVFKELKSLLMKTLVKSVFIYFQKLISFDKLNLKIWEIIFNPLLLMKLF